jgi:N-acetylmuramoyl-L-alanine amidase
LLIASVGPAKADEFIVALDAGHGGSNYGAPTQSPGIFEKHINLSLAKKVQTILSNEKGLRVVLCRTTDALLPIRSRVRCANRAKARLFISLHANAAGPQEGPGSQRGFDLFILPVDEVEKEAARKGLLADSDGDAAWEGFRTRNHAIQSLAAARRIEWRLADALGQDRNRGIKQRGATLDVLQGLDMPAVLVEVGFLDHAEEGKFLLTEKAQETIAQALAGAITDLHAREFRGKREPMTTAPRPGHQGNEHVR